jgi:Tfp pilus assembly protein PilF
MLGLARALVKVDRSDEAKQWLQKALTFNPHNYRAWHELGSIESTADKKSAIADYEKAISIQSNFAPLHRDLGMLQFEEQNYAEAANHLARSAELGLNDAPLFNFLGISYSRTNRLQKAVESYKQALALDPKLAEAHLNLGYAYERLNQPKASRAEYETACRLEEKFCRFKPASKQ